MLLFAICGGLLLILVSRFSIYRILVHSFLFLVLLPIIFILADLWLSWLIQSRKVKRPTIKRSFLFTSPASYESIRTRSSWETSSLSNSPTNFNLETLSGSISHLLYLILRDFVVKWYSSISASPSFPNAIEKTLNETLENVTKRMQVVDLSDVIVGRILPLLTRHIDDFRLAELAIRGSNSDKLTESDELDLFLSSKYGNGKLHIAVDMATGPSSRPWEEAHLRDLVGKILPLIMPEKEVESGAVSVMTREIVACAVLLPIVEMLSDPDFWNKIIESKAGAAIRDQQMVTQFRAALDKQGSTLTAASFSPPASVTKPRPIRKPEEIISARTNPKQFALFLQGIGKCSNLLDARRLRSDVAGQIRKTRALTSDREGHEIVEGGQRVSDLLDYIERLYVAKRKADKRIAELGGSENSNRNSTIGESPAHGKQYQVTLAEILHHPTALSYFMEFMERRRNESSKSRSFRVQFWILIENLKDPLEDVESGQDDDEILPPPSPVTISTCRSDLSMVWDNYFEDNVLGTNSVYLREIKEFIDAEALDKTDKSGTYSAKRFKRVRRALFEAQNDVFTEMEEEDFPKFVKSDLYFKALADLQPQLEGSPTIAPYSMETTELPRPRTQNERPSPLLAQGSFAPPLSPTLPSLFSSMLSVGLPRVDSAPPQVTVSDTFSISDQDSRPPSITSVDGNNSKRRPINLSNSLDFLISPAARDTNRSPLFSTPLFDDEHESDEEGSNTGTPIGNSEDDYVQVQTIEAISEALSSILATDSRNSTRSSQAAEMTSRAFSTKSVPRISPNQTPPSRTVSARSINLEEGRRGSLPKDDQLFDDEPGDVFGEDVRLAEPDRNNSNIRRASPGDYLITEIAKIAATIAKLQNQLSVVDRLIRRAELTGTASELKILVKSKSSLIREMRSLGFQKAQYELQDSESQLNPGRTNVTISGTTIGQADGQNFQLYLVELHQLPLDGSVDESLGSGWIVTRRYSEFLTLHTSLKEKYIAARKLDLPGKKLVTSFTDTFIKNRRVGLEQYLQALVRIPIICQSPELRSFLSQQNISLPPIDSTIEKFPGQSLVKSFYRSVTSSIDLFSGSSTSSMMDTVIQRLSQQANFASEGAIEEDLVSSQILLPSNNGGVSLEIRNEEGISYFTAPICDLFVTLFELKEKNNWLRRQAILIILQQILGGTIERKFRDAIKMITASEQMIFYIQSLKDGLWPDGKLKVQEAPRTTSQKAATKDSANQKLLALMPDIAANLIGRANARQGARRIFAVLQNRRLSKHLVYSILDELIEVIFPELAFKQ